MPFSTSSSPDKKTIVVNDDGQLSVSHEVTKDLRESLLDYAVDIAELNYAQGLNVDSRDNLFVDAFVDDSKISSTTDLTVTTGENGYVELPYVTSDTDSNTADQNASQSSGLSYDVDITDSSIVITQVACRVSDDSAGVTTSEVINMTADDYSRLLDNETITVRINLNNGDVNVYIEDSSGTVIASGTESDSNYTYDTFIYNSGNSYSGTLFSYSTQATNADNYNDILIAEKKSRDKGSLNSVAIDKGFAPSAVQVDADCVTDSDTSVAIRVYDGNGNTTTISESEFGDKITVSFSDSSFNAELQLDTSDSSKTPTVNDYGLNIIE